MQRLISSLVKDISTFSIGGLVVIEEELLIGFSGINLSTWLFLKSGWPAEATVNSEKATKRIKIERDLIVVPLSDSRMRIALNQKQGLPNDIPSRVSIASNMELYFIISLM
jgi:hypothetical protein